MNEKLYIITIALSLMNITASAVQQTADFSRYQVIISRRPFGAPPQQAVVPAVPQKPAEDPFKNYRLVGITRGDADDVSVGIVDIGSNPPKSIFLGLGGADQGLSLVDADFELEGALLRKGNDEKWLYLGGSPGGGGGSTSYSSAGETGASSATSKGVQSYIERMRARRSERGRTVVTKIEGSGLKGPELEQKLREYNMDLIRKAAKGEASGPPLPIPLTPEQDEQLVKEGILPARE